MIGEIFVSFLSLVMGIVGELYNKALLFFYAKSYGKLKEQDKVNKHTLEEAKDAEKLDNHISSLNESDINSGL